MYSQRSQRLHNVYFCEWSLCFHWIFRLHVEKMGFSELQVHVYIQGPHSKNSQVRLSFFIFSHHLLVWLLDTLTLCPCWKWYFGYILRKPWVKMGLPEVQGLKPTTLRSPARWLTGPLSRNDSIFSVLCFILKKEYW